MKPIVEEGVCTLCGRRTKVALFEFWEDQEREMVEMNVSFCAACLYNTLNVLKQTPSNLKESIIRAINQSIQHLQNAIEKIEHGEAGFCLEEIYEAVDQACKVIETIEQR